MSAVFIVVAVLRLSDRQPKIIYRRADYGCSKCHFCPYIAPNGGFLAPNFVFFEKKMQTKKFSDKLFLEGGGCLGKLFTHIASAVSQLQETGVQKGVFDA